jgi:tetratricopeptide (TPR) repeat protein
MKKLFYLLLLSSQLFFAQSSFEAGNDFYKNGKYEEAVKAYTTILKAHKESSELYFNLGNCYYQLNKVAPAIYNYEKALLLNPKDTQISTNLRFAQKRTVDEIKVVPKVGFGKLLRDFTAIYDFNSWGVISVGFSVLFLLFFLGYYFFEAVLIKRTFFLGMFIVLLLLLVCVSAAIFEKSHYLNERPAIVFAEQTDVKKEPQRLGKVVLVIHEGTKVFVKETVDNWNKIQLTDGTEGWIEKNAILEIK